MGGHSPLQKIQNRGQQIWESKTGMIHIEKCRSRQISSPASLSWQKLSIFGKPKRSGMRRNFQQHVLLKSLFGRSYSGYRSPLENSLKSNVNVNHRLRGGTSNTLTEETPSPEPWLDEEDYVAENRTVYGMEVPEGYVHEDAPDSDEDTEDRNIRENQRNTMMQNEEEWTKSGWRNISSTPNIERAIIAAGIALFEAGKNVTADKIYDMCVAATEGAEEEVEIPYWLCLSYAKFMADPQRLDDLIYNHWRYDNEGNVIPQLAPGCGAQAQGRLGVYGEPGSAIGGGGGGGGRGGGGGGDAGGGSGKSEGNKKAAEQKKKEETPEESEEQEFDLFD